MSGTNGVDSFIEYSSKLLLAYPSTTLSITYANVEKNHKNAKQVDTESKRATNKVTFKCYEPHSGKCVKYSTTKVKEFSRLMTFVGPRGVLVSRPKRKSEVLDTETSEETSDKKTKTDLVTENRAGLASIMSNVKFEEETIVSKVATPQPEEKDATPVNTASKNKKKKKKGKK